MNIFKQEAFSMVGGRAFTIVRMLDFEMPDEEIRKCMQDWYIFKAHINRLDSEIESIQAALMLPYERKFIPDKIALAQFVEQTKSEEVDPSHYKEEMANLLAVTDGSSETLFREVAYQVLTRNFLKFIKNVANA